MPRPIRILLGSGYLAAAWIAFDIVRVRRGHAPFNPERKR